MAHNDFKRYIWLIETLNRNDGVSFEDLNKIWQDDPVLNPDEAPLPLKTFYNHLKAIKEIFGISIQLNRKDKKYRVVTDDSDNVGSMQRALMSTLSLNGTIERYKDLEGRILYEEEPYVYPEWMRQIMHAMKYNRKIRLDYRKYGEDTISHREICPYCLKMFRRRWYLLALDGKVLKTFALDNRTVEVKELDNRTVEIKELDNRTVEIKERDKEFDYPRDFDAGAYFRDAFGIRNGKPSEVLVKALKNEADYWRSAPLHPSQKEIETTDDYAVFSLNVNIDAWEFIQELLSRGDRIEVLSPVGLRRIMAMHIEEMRKLYAEFWQ